MTARTLSPVFALALTLACGAAAAASDSAAGDAAAPAFGAQQGVGAKYGAHDPRTCPTAKQPASGAPSAAQAAAYVVCNREGEFGENLYLLDHVEVTAIAKGRRYNMNEDINVPNIDVSAPVFAIRGHMTVYQCGALTTPQLMKAGFADNRGKNCNANDQPNASGLCYKDTFADWHCSMVDADHVITDTRRDVAPPPAS